MFLKLLARGGYHSSISFKYYLRLLYAVVGENMAENIDDICVQHTASRNLEESERKGSIYEEWGCYDCDGYKKECEHNAPLSELRFEIDE